jgi:hypothetical protein
MPCVLPPPWASLRVKLEQQFFRGACIHPADIIETASFLAQITFVQQRDAVAFMARSVAGTSSGKACWRSCRSRCPSNCRLSA